MECYYGKAERRRLIGWLVISSDGSLKYVRLRSAIKKQYEDGRLNRGYWNFTYADR